MTLEDRASDQDRSVEGATEYEGESIRGKKDSSRGEGVGYDNS